MKKNNIAIYTAIFGDYDDIIEPPKEIKGCDFYCFTDSKKLKSKRYEIVKVKREFSDPTRDARKIKTLSHKYLPDYEYILWIDASVIFKEIDIRGMFDKFLAKRDIAIYGHNLRDCLYDEFGACLEVGVDEPVIMASQIIRYINEGYPAHNGLVETGVIFRRHNPAIKKVNEDWWNEIKTNSKRDQLSINYVLWKNNLEYFKIDGNVRDGELFSLKKHKKNNVSRARNLELNEMRKRIVEMESNSCSKCYVDESKNREITFLKNELEKKDKLVDTMENSIFWKMRNVYLKLKYLILRKN